MPAVNDVYGSNTASALANAQTKNLMGDTQDRFLTLLVTQLKNQDPLNPMDNAEVTSQIAQLSMVNGIQGLNNTLLALSGQMDMSQSLQAVNASAPSLETQLRGHEDAYGDRLMEVDSLSLHLVCVCVSGCVCNGVCAIVCDCACLLCRS